MNHHASQPDDRARPGAAGPAGAALWASAMILAALVIVQAGRLWSAPAPALAADLVAAGGDYVTLSVDAGNDDVLVVLDHRSEDLLVYHPRNQSDLEFKSRQNLRELFFAGRRAAGAPAQAPGPARDPNPAR